MASTTIGIRREDKNRWEKRVPFTPAAIKELVAGGDVEFLIQPSDIRIFSNRAFREAGAQVQEDLSPARMIFAVKEVPISLIMPEKVYVFFSHTIKGQPHNMPLLEKMLESGCTLVDYERIVDDENRRLVFFGSHAGYAGMIDTLHLMGKRYALQGIHTPFANIKMAHGYSGLREARAHISQQGAILAQTGLPAQMCPLVVGFLGNGNVSKGAQSILKELPTRKWTPRELLEHQGRPDDTHRIHYVVFNEWDLVQRKDGDKFDLRDYYEHPEAYENAFGKYLPFLRILINAVYWNEKYPRFVTKAMLQQGFKDNTLRKLDVIGDLTIDLNGSIEASHKATLPDAPSYVYRPEHDDYVDGVLGDGPAILAVDNLPCELSRAASRTFSKALNPLVPHMTRANWTGPLNALDIPDSLKRAIIVYQGKLTPDYQYLQAHLNQHTR